MIGPARIRQVATATGFREEIVEKVLYLEAILDQLGPRSTPKTGQSSTPENRPVRE